MNPMREQPQPTRAQALGSVLRTARQRRGLTQQAAAAQAGISRPHLANLEAGRHKPSVTVARILDRVLALTPAERDQLAAAILPDARQRSRPPLGERTRDRP
jgi:transcriptional regulator with XRE-family HTH domain